MSYDIFIYKSKLGIPDEDEADSVINADNYEFTKNSESDNAKLTIVKALTDYNPKLSAFDFDYQKIAKLSSISLEEAMKNFDHIELNPQEDEIAIQLTVYDNHVFITVPYWYQGEKARQLFNDIKGYIKVIHKTAGYFVFDPQTAKVFDPSQENFEGLDKYLSVSEHLDEIVNSQESVKNEKRPWWKIW